MEDLGVPRLYFDPPEEGVLDFPEDFRLAFCGVFFPFLDLLEVSSEEGRDLLLDPLGERNESRLACERDRLRERTEGEGLGRGSVDTEDTPSSNCLMYSSCRRERESLLTLSQEKKTPSLVSPEGSHLPRSVIQAVECDSPSL